MVRGLGRLVEDSNPFQENTPVAKRLPTCIAPTSRFRARVVVQSQSGTMHHPSVTHFRRPDALVCFPILFVRKPMFRFKRAKVGLDLACRDSPFERFDSLLRNFGSPNVEQKEAVSLRKLAESLIAEIAVY